MRLTQFNVNLKTRFIQIEQLMARETQQEAVAIFNFAAANENDIKSVDSREIRHAFLFVQLPSI